MSEYRLTDGNLIILYAVHKDKSSVGSLPDYIQERVKVGLETYGMVMRSKADSEKTMVVIVGEPTAAKKVTEMVVQGGVAENRIAIDSDSTNMAQTIDRIHSMIKNKPNPPFIYIIGSVWLHDIVNSTVLSKMKGYRVQFYGALDHRPVKEVEREKAVDVPTKGTEYYKKQAKNKAVDILLNIIFPD
jgi:hypothetical protein